MQKNSRINNSRRLKENNRFAILDLLRRNGPMSRKDIAEAVNLTQASVTILTGELINEDILLETGVVRTSHAGRSKVLLDINYLRAYVVGITLDTVGIELAAAKLGGDIIASEKRVHTQGYGSMELLDATAAFFNEFLSAHNIPRERVGCAGVGIIGLVDAVKGISLDSYGVLPPETEVAELLSQKLGLPVTADNVVRGIALAELDFRREPADLSGLFVKYGPGIGSAIIVENEVHYGVSSRSGEIGHCIAEPTREMCVCGKRGCLERLIGLDAFKKQALGVFSLESTPRLYELCNGDPRQITIESIVEATDRGDPPLGILVEKSLFYLAVAIVNALEVVDGHQVILYGYLFNKDWACRRLAEVIDDISAHRMPVEVVKSIHIGESQCIGSVAVAIRHYFMLV